MPMDEILYQRILAQDETLTKVDVSYQDLSEDDITNLLRALIKNEIVQSINISGNNITSRNLPLLFSSSLRIPRIIARYCEMVDIPSLSPAPDKDGKTIAITHLDLTGNNISTASIIELSKSRLEYLSLADAGLVDEEAAPLADMPSIHTLILSHNAIAIKTTTRLAGNTTLRKLFLHNNNMAAADIIPVLTSPTIVELGIGGNSFDKSAALAIAKNKIIETLNVNNCKITDEVVIELLKLSTLKFLSISHNFLTENSASYFLAVALIRLNISFNKMGDNGAKIIAQHPSLTNLVISYNKISLEGGFYLSKNSLLKTLDLSSNDVKKAVFMLAANKTLTSLSLFDNRIDDTAVFAFTQNTTLEFLDLGYHDISDIALELFSQQRPPQMRVNISTRQLYDRKSYEAVFNSDTPALICDPFSKVIQAVSPALIASIGFAANQLVGKPVFEFLHPKDINAEHAAEQSAMANEDQKEQPSLQELYKKESFNYQYLARMRCKDGSYRYIQWRSWFRNGAQMSVGYDITLQKRAEQSLSLVERDTYFRQTMAYQFHEIRNLINASGGITDEVTLAIDKIKSLLTDLKTNLPTNISVNVQSKLSAIQTSIDEISVWLNHQSAVIKDQRQILDESLDFSKLEANKVVFKEDPLNLKQLIQLVISRNKVEAEKKHVLFEFKADDTWVLGDEKYIGQIITNLVGNAVKFSPVNGIITIEMILHSLDSIYSSITVNVSDQGPGIKKDDLPQLFHAYHQTAVGKSKEHSTGLGLNIANKLAKQMISGGITVKSEEGKGATFTLSCNLARSEPVISLKNPKKLKPTTYFFKTLTPEILGDKYILIAEDSLVGQKLLERQFKGYKLLFVSTGTEALIVYQKHKKDIFLVLMDVNMPGRTGFQVAKEIRADHQDLLEQKINELKRLQSDVPIVLMSASVTDEDKEKAKELGVNAILVKPLNNEELQSVVENNLPTQPNNERTTSAPHPNMIRRKTVTG